MTTSRADKYHLYGITYAKKLSRASREYISHHACDIEHDQFGLSGSERDPSSIVRASNHSARLKTVEGRSNLYTRNLVDEGNGRFNLMVLCWGEGHGSAIHDHANAHCVMKILQGKLCETRYAWPNLTSETEDNTHTLEELRELDRNTLDTNEICYINDSMGLHRVENSSATNPAVSLHLYSPPFSTCSVFNKQTGQKSACKVTFWSKYGERRNREIQDTRSPEDN
ncbi:cysteine dioxygenase type 1 isoform X2 [Harpegnathos saltator]|uniref:cysteine dioxygenase type 1 isoform X2 n=1 Tax=Harpegnathos saltator TaxID=610380 RepID=UPI000DBEE436|nr:cysteine dioxygenase type 1 isoform X2 [Harpegnathos saltator]